MMALFNKIFSTNKKKNVNTTIQQNVSSQFSFNADQVRILLYRECDVRGKRLLFDSSAVKEISNNNNVQTAQNLSPASSTTAEITKNSPCNGRKSIPTHSYSYPIESCDGVSYKYAKPNPDYNNLGEMIFGAVAMSFRGTMLKVHWMQQPTRLMCSQVFLIPIQNSKGTSISSQPGSESNGHHLHTSTSDLSSMDTNSIQSFSMSLNLCVNDNFSLSDRDSNLNGRSPYDTYDSRIDSGCGTDPWSLSTGSISRYPFSSQRSSLASIWSDSDSNRKYSVDSTAFEMHPYCQTNADGNCKRRITRSLSTSFENRQTLCDQVGHIGEYTSSHVVNSGSGPNPYVTVSDGCMTRFRRNSEIVEVAKRKATSGDALAGHRRRSSRRARLGIAICITLNENSKQEMEHFCSEHMAILETILCRLRAKAENAYANQQQFLQVMLRAWQSTKSWIKDLFSAPRLLNPIWLTLNSGSKNAEYVSNFFMCELSSLLATADTKDTNFFISTLLTAILTHHLGWVASFDKKLPKKDVDHPYNALWAQLSDLYGAIGYPAKLAKTIIYGNQNCCQTIDKILNVLTYFIRCNEIKRRTQIELFDRDSINEALQKQATSNLSQRKFVEPTVQIKPSIKTNGLIRSATRVKNLSSFKGENGQNVHQMNKMNDIPNVLVYRDSRFVQQELRIGNASMDTGIVMNPKEKQYLAKTYQINNVGTKFKFTVTTPDNVVEEAIELDSGDESQQGNMNATLSGLITRNSMGCTLETDSKFVWGDDKSRDHLNEVLVKSRGSQTLVEEEKPVVFVLGENEQLVNIKGSHGSIAEENKENIAIGGGGLKVCSHNKIKKHSGVRFNFEQYPQIATNYMKNKNLDISAYNILEKGLKMEKEFKLNGHASTSMLHFTRALSIEEEEECEICRGYLQTPSNASELEFSNDLTENNYSSLKYETKSKQITIPIKIEEKIDQLLEKQGKIIDIPLSKTSCIDCRLGAAITKRVELKPPGFMPSLFSHISDHYIPDMILQGTTAPPENWEVNLMQDLALSSHCATIEQFPTENVAVLANIENYDVRFVTSHSIILPPGESCGNMVGMSQLVASMLETVQAMWQSGISAFHCMSFIESRLQEMYFQSETLASYLLATEFCSMTSLTSALDLSANDIPLLLSVASVHSPSVTKKYGVSFRA